MEYFDENHLAKRLGISARTIARWRATGEGPSFVRLGTRRMAYRIADVEAWAASRTFCSRAAELARTMEAHHG